MNDNDLGRLVNLLSYLKKHDDVEQELGKARSHHASGRTNVERDETQTRLRTALGVPNEEFDPAKLQARKDQRTSSSADTTSDMPKFPDSTEDWDSTEDVSQKEIWTRIGKLVAEYGITTEGKALEMLEGLTSPTSSDEGVVDPYKFYHSGGGETGKRGGRFDTVGDTPIESVTAKNSATEPALHHLIRSVDELPEGAEATYRRMLGKSGMAKSSESILLSLLKRLGT